MVSDIFIDFQSRFIFDPESSLTLGEMLTSPYKAQFYPQRG